jgi:hypothetical protein
MDVIYTQQLLLSRKKAIIKAIIKNLNNVIYIDNVVVLMLG